MTIIGLIGRIGAGKSTVARRFAALGAHVIDADRIAHEVLAEPEVVRALAAAFGPDVIDDEGHVRRRALAGLVFGGTPEHVRALEQLESLVHPRVRSRIERDLAAVAAADRPAAAAPAVVLDVPLLVQAGWAARCDRLVMVTCDEEERRRRLDARGWSREEREARDGAWSRTFPAASLPAGKLATVDASGDLAYTHAQVDLIWSGLFGSRATTPERG